MQKVELDGPSAEFVRLMTEQLRSEVQEGHVTPDAARYRVMQMRGLEPVMPDNEAIERIGKSTGDLGLDHALLTSNLQQVITDIKAFVNFNLELLDQRLLLIENDIKLIFNDVAGMPWDGVVSTRAEAEAQHIPVPAPVSAFRFRDMAVKFKELEHVISIILGDLNEKKRNDGTTSTTRGLGWEA